jgi:predicted transcriptional regulator
MDDGGEGHGGGDVDLQFAWLAATSLEPAEQLAAAVDLDSWLITLSTADRELLAGRMAGFSLQELASQADRSVTTVFQRLRDLGGDLATHAGIMIAKKIRKPRTKVTAATA